MLLSLVLSLLCDAILRQVADLLPDPAGVELDALAALLVDLLNHARYDIYIYIYIYTHYNIL